MKRVHLIPALRDNYIFCLQNGTDALIVDPGESAPVLKFLRERSLSLRGVLVTHHHHDHVQGVPGILDAHPVPVWIPALDRNRFGFGGHPLREGDLVECAGFRFRVWELPGHTLDHIAYLEEKEKWVFSGDVLFGFGCGRLFEGSYEEAYRSLQRFHSLPPETRIYCAHEYTLANLRFLEGLLADTSACRELIERQERRLREEGATVPLELPEQRHWNPFLKAETVEIFKDLRMKRNS